MTSRSTSNQSGTEYTSSPTKSNRTARSETRGSDPTDPPDGLRPRSSITGPWPWRQAAAAGAGRGQSRAEVPRLRVMRDQRVRGLLRGELELLGQHDPDPLRAEQPHHLRPVLEIGAGRVPGRVTAAPVTDLEDALQRGRIEPGQAQLFAHPAVPVLREGLGELNGQPVQLQVIPEGVLGEQLAGRLAELRADRDQLEAHHVGVTRGGGPEEVGQAQVAVVALPREPEPLALRAAVVEHHEVVALADGREVAVHHRGLD